ncbi:MAG: hypothetical protein DYG97_10205 [Ignavibacteria bacterium CHB3]|nr:hypothetical protein [Ignavibacteria bacterium CHB3]
METKLKEGMRIRLPHSGVFDVVLVNESRAHITPVKKSDGGIGYDMDISPNSEVEILSVIASGAKQSQEELF